MYLIISGVYFDVYEVIGLYHKREDALKKAEELMEGIIEVDLGEEIRVDWKRSEGEKGINFNNNYDFIDIVEIQPQ